MLEIFRSLSQDVPVSCFLEAAAPHRPCLSPLQGAECRGWGCWDSEPCWRQKYCWAAHADKCMVSPRLESVGSQQLENEIRSQFSNPVFQKRENEPAESFLRESKQRPRQRKGGKLDAKLLAASVIPSLLPLLLRLKATHLNGIGGVKSPVPKWGKRGADGRPLWVFVVQGEVTRELCTECEGLPYLDMVKRPRHLEGSMSSSTWGKVFICVLTLKWERKQLWLGARSFHKAGRDQNILGEISYVAALGVGKLLSYMLHTL